MVLLSYGLPVISLDLLLVHVRQPLVFASHSFMLVTLFITTKLLLSLTSLPNLSREMRGGRT